MLTTFEDTFEEAIRCRRVMNINYPPGNRVVEPHTLGYSSEGKILIRVFQRNGASESGQASGWKLLRGDKLAAVSIQSEEFNAPRPGYTKGDSVMRGGIIAEL